MLVEDVEGWCGDALTVQRVVKRVVEAQITEWVLKSYLACLDR